MTVINTTFSTITVNTKTEQSDFNIAVSDRSDIETLVKSFQDRNKDQSQAVSNASKALVVASQDALYDMLALSLAICLVMREPGNLQFVIAELRRHGFNGFRKGANEFGPLVAMLFGHWTEKKDKETGKTVKKFIKNRSAEKYAKVLRLLAAKGVKPEDAAAFIKAFSGKMEGILEADTKLHSKSDVEEQEIEDAVKDIQSKPALATVSKSAIGLDSKDTRSYVALWAEVVNGQVHIKGMLPTGEDAIAAAIRKMAKVVAPELAKRKAERVQDDEPDIAESFPDDPEDEDMAA